MVVGRFEYHAIDLCKFSQNLWENLCQAESRICITHCNLILPGSPGRLGEYNMNEIMEYLEATAKHISKELGEIHSRTDHEHGLVFPRKRDGSIRISEQEAKTLFLHRVLSERRFCLSVEVPTEQRYRQKGSKEISARVDLTLLKGSTQRCAHVEFKAHNCGVEDIRKDLEKLLRENSTGMWFHVLENANRGTIKSLMGKFRKALESLSADVETCGCSFLFAICVLRKGCLQLRWLDFTGDVENNRAVVDDAFGKDGATVTCAQHWREWIVN